MIYANETYYFDGRCSKCGQRYQSSSGTVSGGVEKPPKDKPPRHGPPLKHTVFQQANPLPEHVGLRVPVEIPKPRSNC